MVCYCCMGKMERALPQVRQGSFLYLFSDCIYTYERCSLTTVGVVTGATTNMYVQILLSLSFVV